MVECVSECVSYLVSVSVIEATAATAAASTATYAAAYPEMALTGNTREAFEFPPPSCSYTHTYIYTHRGGKHSKKSMENV